MQHWRTYSISIRIISRRAEGQIIMEHRILHFILYTLGGVILTPFIWQVAIFEESRKAWVKAYVKAIIGIKK